MFKRIFKINNLKQSFFLFGPRGTGKTTWIKNNFKNAIYFDLLDSETNQTLLANPSRITKYIPKNYKNWIIIDEVQKIPDLLNEIHKLIESEKYKFILTGSSARSLRKKGVNLLAGRALTYYFHPLTHQELEDKFSLKHSLRFGQLPMAYTFPNPDQFLNSYVQTYLREEVLQEGLTRNLGNFSRFLEIASFSQGEVLNISQVASDANLERKTTENYFSILEDLLIAYRIPVFNRRAKRKLISHNKFYFFDTGVFSTIRPKGLIDTKSEIEGPALETLFLQEIRAINDYYHLEYNIHYWRSKTGLEVDFALYGPKGFLGIEIKRKSNIRSQDLKSLNIFGKDYPEAKLFVFCSVSRPEYHNNITILPLEKALDELDKILKNNFPRI